MLTTKEMIETEGYRIYTSKNSNIEVLAKVNADDNEVFFAPKFPNEQGKFCGSEYFQITSILQDNFDYRNHEYTISIVCDADDFAESFN